MPDARSRSASLVRMGCSIALFQALNHGEQIFHLATDEFYRAPGLPANADRPLPPGHPLRRRAPGGFIR